MGGRISWIFAVMFVFVFALGLWLALFRGPAAGHSGEEVVGLDGPDGADGAVPLPGGWQPLEAAPNPARAAPRAQAGVGPASPPAPGPPAGETVAAPDLVGYISPDEPLDRFATWPTTRDGIQSAIMEREPEFEDCYRSWYEADPDLEGIIKTKFTIRDNDEGASHVTDISTVKSDVSQPFMKGCVQSVFEDLQFEALESGIWIVSFTIQFKDGVVTMDY